MGILANSLLPAGFALGCYAQLRERTGRRVEEVEVSHIRQCLTLTWHVEFRSSLDWDDSVTFYEDHASLNGLSRFVSSLIHIQLVENKRRASK